MRLNGQNAMIWLRKQTPNTSGLLNSFAGVLANLYGTGMTVTEQIAGGEWGIIGSIA
jgi:hypothetical protein